MKKIIIMVAIVCIALVGGYFILASTASEFTEDWGIVDEYDLTGTWRITPYLTTADGERISMLEKPFALWVRVGDQYIETIEYVLEAKATRSMETGSFNSVKIGMTNFNVNFKIPNPSNPLLGDVTYLKQGFGTKTLTFQGAETPWTEVLVFTMPTDFTHIILPGQTNPVPGTPKPTMAEILAEFPSKVYQVKYTCSGNITFQGLNAVTGDGKVQNANLPGTVTAHIEVGQHTVQLDWKTTVTYS